MRLLHGGWRRNRATPNKKADVTERPQAFHHVGLLVNERPGQRRVALYLVVRQVCRKNPSTWLRLQRHRDYTPRGGGVKQQNREMVGNGREAPAPRADYLRCLAKNSFVRFHIASLSTWPVFSSMKNEKFFSACWAS